MKSIILIVGRSGFIASNLIESYKANKKIIAISLKKNYITELTKKYSLNLSINKFIIIFTTSIDPKKIKDISMMKKNENLLKKFVLSMNKKNILKFIYLSTIDVYSKKNFVNIKETSIVKPTNLYGRSKLNSENFLTKYFSERNKLVILRLPGVFGKNDKYKSTIGKMVKSSINNRKIYLYNEGKDIRDYLYIDNLTKFIKEVVKSNFYGKINVVSGNQVSLLEIAKIIKEKNKSKIIYKNNKQKIAKVIFNNNKLKENFSKFKFTDLKKSIYKYCLLSKNVKKI